MSLTYGFYNSVEGDRKYDAIQMGQIFDGIITDGIYATYLKAMVVKASDNASEVIVQPGRAWFNHTWTYIDADYPVTAPAPEVILDRIDTLVLDINTENAARENSLVWVQGTPASVNPPIPALIKSATHNQYPLCNVYRKAGTTMIYAADITNRVGTSDTPFVTGVLDRINVDDLLAQWDDEFHTWEDMSKTTYNAFFTAIQSQMQGDLADVEAWIQSIKDIIDEEAATRLQAEIDELKTMLPAGSHITITTTNPNLYNMNVVVSDGSHTTTTKFDSSGVAVVESFPYVGVIQITSSDGLITTTRRVNTPYFARYSFTFELWNATVNITGDENLYGYTVSIKNGLGIVIDSVQLDSSTGTAVWTATEADTYTFYTTYEGEIMEVSLAVTQEKTYEVNLETYTIYGFHIDGSESAPTAKISYAVQYDGKNVENYGYTPASMNFSTGVINPGSWNLTDDFFIPRSCMLKYDGSVDYYLNENDETKKADGSNSDVANTSYAGNAMMEWGRDGKQIWIKIVPDEDDDSSATIYVSDKQVDSGFHAYSFYDCDGNLIPHCYTAKYNGVNVSSKLRSISGQAILNNVAGTTEISYATANNTKSGKTEWYIEQFADRLMVNILLMMIGKSTNMQTKFGNGHYTGGSSASNLLRTGTMNGLGQFYGTNGTGKGVKVFGMENWWGNQWRRTAGLLNMSGTQKYKLTWSTVDGSSQVGYDATGAGYLIASSATPAGTSGGYINKMKFMSKAFVAVTSSGSDSTHYCDGQWFNNGQANYALFGGSCAYDLRVGAFSCSLTSAVSDAGWGIGAPLSCKPLAS